jgi:hypothetical protein
MQSGAYILEDADTFTSVVAGIATLTAHGYLDGDLVYIEGLSEVVEVDNAAANTFQFRSLATGALLDFTAVGSPDVQRVFTLVSPYDPDDLGALT